MKHAINSDQFRVKMEGFRHGASRQPMSGDHTGDKNYDDGYRDGQQAHRIYSECLCRKLGLVDPIIKVS